MICVITATGAFAFTLRTKRSEPPHPVGFGGSFITYIMIFYISGCVTC